MWQNLAILKGFYHAGIIILIGIAFGIVALLIWG